MEKKEKSAWRITLTAAQTAQIISHAQEAQPEECCGLLGGVAGAARSVYRLRNIAPNPCHAYEAAPEELFAAHRAMRERGESVAGIYHSHPRQAEPVPSVTDVRLAYYPSAVYFIVGLGGAGPVVRAFRLDEKAGGWERVEYAVKEG